MRVERNKKTNTLGDIEMITDTTFAAACYNTSTAADLETALASGPNPQDMKTWGLSPRQWHNEILLALDELAVRTRELKNE